MDFNPTEDQLCLLLFAYKLPERVAEEFRIPISSVLCAMTRFGIPVYLSYGSGAIRRAILEMRMQYPGITGKKIGDLIGLKPSRIYLAMRDMRPLTVPTNVANCDDSVVPLKCGTARRQQLRQLWEELGHPFPIAKRLGLTVSSVCGRLRNIGIDVRMRYDRKLRVYDIEIRHNPTDIKPESTSGPQVNTETECVGKEEAAEINYVFGPC